MTDTAHRPDPDRPADELPAATTPAPRDAREPEAAAASPRGPVGKAAWLGIVAAVALLGLLAGIFLPRVSETARRFSGTPSTAATPAATGDAAAARRGGGEINGQSSGPARAAPAAGEGLLKLTAEQIASQEIETARVANGTLSRHVIVPGTITPDADRVVRVPARVVGTVAEMRKRLGDMVKAGEVVAVLDSREVADAKSEYLTASVNSELQKTNFERQQALWDRRISAELQFLQAKATYSEAQLRFDLARQKLSALGLNASEVADIAKQDNAGSGQSSLRQYEIRSPIAGRVVERRVDVGTAVGKEGDPSDLYMVADLSTVWVDLTVAPNDLSKIKEGSRVTITASGDEERRAEAQLMFVSPILTAETRSARVIASLDNKDLSWRPGSFVTAEIEIARDPARLIVPRPALQTMGGERVAFQRVPEGFARRDVKVGRIDDDSFEIVSGLSAGDEIAVKNTFLLKAELGKADAAHND